MNNRGAKVSEAAPGQFRFGLSQTEQLVPASPCLALPSLASPRLVSPRLASPRLALSPPGNDSPTHDLSGARRQARHTWALLPQVLNYHTPLRQAAAKCRLSFWIMTVPASPLCFVNNAKFMRVSVLQSGVEYYDEWWFALSEISLRIHLRAEG
ncbi:hypothetical protein E2C01_035079 [Portunus trituberculatus]|uniref:Uncharacterized protein n=1 Tax=Portunus trituberculatus TaxID=210409 RepID=A0A5B7F7H0_PORTR|nr:hypothetical protein [Portunus trituberculatus]